MRLFLRIAFIFGFLLAPVLVLAQSQPGGIPHQFYGEVKFAENRPAPNGLIVEAKIGDESVATTTTQRNGKYGYSPLFFVTDPYNNWARETINFFVEGIDTGESATFVNGEHTKMDFLIRRLNIGTITKAETQTIEEQFLITPAIPAVIKVGDKLLNVNISSQTNTTTTIKIQKLKSDFFTGATAILSGQNLLNAFEIKITGNVSIKVIMSYDDTGIDEGTIAPYRFDGTSWVPIEYLRDKVANTITFNIPAQTPYAIFGSPIAYQPTLGPTGGPTGGGGGGGAGDTTAPSISEINVVPGIDEATITWKTDEPSISWVVYGTTTDYGKEIKTTNTTSHSLTLTDLSPATLYHYQIKSRDSAGNTGSSSDKTFTTKAKPLKGDINNDGKVDKYDFALMMANWGKIGANTSDLNNDGKVDKYDFAILMANWTIT